MDARRPAVTFEGVLPRTFLAADRWFGILPMLSIILAMSISALPDPPTGRQVEDAAEKWTEANLKNLDGQIAEYKELLERAYAAKARLVVDGKKVSKLEQVRDLHKKIKELEDHRELARMRKWFRPLPGNAVDVFNKGIFYGRVLTFVKQTEGIATFECENAATVKTAPPKDDADTEPSRKPKLTLLVRGLTMGDLEENAETDVLVGVPLYVSGRAEIERDGKTVRAIVLDVVEP